MHSTYQYIEYVILEATTFNLTMTDVWIYFKPCKS